LSPRVLLSFKAIVTEVNANGGYYRNRKIRQCELDGGFMLPVDIFDQMYPHQKEGVRWLWQRHNAEVQGGILGDDMGYDLALLLCVSH